MENATFSIPLSVSASLLAGVIAYKLIGNARIQQNFIRCGLFGRDLHRPNRPTIPESMGVVCGLTFLISTFFMIPFSFIPHIQRTSPHAPKNVHIDIRVANDEFPYDNLASFLSALLSLTCMLFLGFSDDVLELAWRFKLLLPTIASIPLLMVYYVTCGVTTVVTPQPLRWLFGHFVHLGFMYYVYMGMLAVFCTNAINILAGINGVEAVQALIIGLTIAFNDFLYLHPVGSLILDKTSVSGKAAELHRFSLCMILPFVAVTFALYLRNKYPAQVFVGDTFCYFSGMIFAVVGILGRYSKTLLLFFIPQIFNFLYSIPQLFRFVPCPRHRMPVYDEETDLLYPSYAPLNRDNKLGMLIIKIFHFFRLVELVTKSDDEKDATVSSRSTRKNGSVRKQSDSYTHVNNLTLLNLILIKTGPLHESTLTNYIAAVQIIFGSILALVIRYGLVSFAYPQ